MKVLLTDDPYPALDVGKMEWERGRWPCQWIACPGAGEPPFVTAYRRRFRLERDAVVRVHVSADERYELFVDGVRVGRGNERGDTTTWFFDTYDLDLVRGEHLIVARVWALGARAPFAQMSVRPGFLLSPEADEMIALLGTGVSAWETKKLPGHHWLPVTLGSTLTGDTEEIDGEQFPWGFQSDAADGADWLSARPLGFAVSQQRAHDFPPGHLLAPATLPPMLETPVRAGVARHVDAAPVFAVVDSAAHLAAEAAGWNDLLRGGGPLLVPPHTARRIILDLGDYYCVYPELRVTGGRGSTVRVHWAESLYEDPAAGTKGHRGEIDGKYFHGAGDTFKPDGGQGRVFETLWWRCGRYVEVRVETAGDALDIEHLGWRETRYPLEMESTFSASDPRLGRFVPLGLRALQTCAHETYVDCPYYEQLMYAGDTRLEVLLTYALTRDDRLPRKALQTFADSRLPSGLTRSRYPCRYTQIIPPFSLWWVAMVHDFAYWRDDLAFVRRLLPNVRSVVDGFLPGLNPAGLLVSPAGWNFADWVPGWGEGVPPDGDGISGLFHWHLALTLGLAADLETLCGEPELAARARRHAADLAAAAEAFWDPARGLYADDLARSRFSEHTQCLAILSGHISPERRALVARGLVGDPSLARTTIYFSHYLFEAYRATGQIAALFARLEYWFGLEGQGFKTTPESPTPRSDCHAWGAHPLFHYFATILGVRPASPGFRTVSVDPRLGPLASASGRMVHPRGEIVVDCRQEAGSLQGTVSLPAGIDARLPETDHGLRVHTSANA